MTNCKLYSDSVENRLLRAGEKYSQRLEIKRKQKNEKNRREEDSLKPKQRPASAGRVQDRLYSMNDYYKQKKIERQIEEAEKLNSVLKEPKLCKRSLEIARKSDRPARIEERLFDEAQKSTELLSTKKLISELAIKLASKPNISPYAKKIQRKGDIAERLANYKIIYEGNIINLKRRYESETEYNKSQSPSKFVKREVPLMDRPILSKSKPEIDFPFAPQLCKKSLEIAGKLGKSTDRLIRLSPSPSRVIEDRECSFSPLINKNSEKLDRRQKFDEEGEKTERWDALYNLRNINSEKRRWLLDARLEEEENLCIFHPMVSPPKKEFDPDRLVERLNGWNRVRKEKINRIRENELDEDLKHCTFKPETCESPYSNTKNSLTEWSTTQNSEKYLSSKKKSKDESLQLSSDKKKPEYKELNANEFLVALKKLHFKLHDI